MLVAVTPEERGELAGRAVGHAGGQHVGRERARRQPTVAQHLADVVVGQHDRQGSAVGVDRPRAPRLGGAAVQLADPVCQVGVEVEVDDACPVPASSVTAGA